MGVEREGANRPMIAITDKVGLLEFRRESGDACNNPGRAMISPDAAAVPAEAVDARRGVVIARPAAVGDDDERDDVARGRAPAAALLSPTGTRCDEVDAAGGEAAGMQRSTASTLVALHGGAATGRCRGNLRVEADVEAAWSTLPVEKTKGREVKAGGVRRGSYLAQPAGSSAGRRQWRLICLNPGHFKKTGILWACTVS